MWKLAYKWAKRSHPKKPKLKFPPDLGQRLLTLRG
jgi:hypothetical protein